MNTQQILSAFGKPLQDIARFSVSPRDGLSLRAFALFLLYREDWERTFTFSGALSEPVGTVAISRHTHDLLASTAARVMMAPEIAPFILGSRPANVALPASQEHEAYVLAVQGGRALVICSPHQQRLAYRIIAGVSKILSRVNPAISQVDILSVSSQGTHRLSREPLSAQATPAPLRAVL